MHTLSNAGKTFATVALYVLTVSAAWPAEINVMISGGFREAYEKLKLQFEERTGHKLVTVSGASGGTSPTAIPARLRRGEPADVVILNRGGLNRLVQDGHAVAGSEMDLSRSFLGLAVKKGSSLPDISTVDALRQALVLAKTVAYYDSGSGCGAACQLFRRLQIDPTQEKYIKFSSIVKLGAAIANGTAEIGLNQVSELLPQPGVHVVGPVPQALQAMTFYSAGVATNAKQPAEARLLIEFLASNESTPAIEESGLQAISR